MLGRPGFRKGARIFLRAPLVPSGGGEVMVKTKSEIRNPKSETNSKIQNPNVPNRGAIFVLNFLLGYLDLFRISDFGFRISFCHPVTLPGRPD
jgi:hypothetical protein